MYKTTKLMRPSIVEWVVLLTVDALVLSPAVGWALDLSRGRMVDVPGMGWFAWMVGYTTCVGLTAISTYRWMLWRR
jgi:hypothetical protein